MPVQITKTPVANVEETDVEKLLFNEDGTMTAQGQVVDSFLETVDFSEMFEDPDLAEFIEHDESNFKIEDDEVIATKEGDETGALGVVHSLDGGVIALLIDEDDLHGMFEFWAVNEMDTSTLEGRVLQTVAFELLGVTEDDIELDETFKKGAFRKIHKSVSGGPAIVNRMLGAMLNKEAINRAKGGPGTGYKSGDYQKDPSGYGSGKGSALKKYKKISKKAKTGAGKKAAAATKKTKGKLSKFSKGGGKKVAKKKGKGLAAAKAKALGLKKGKKKSLAAGDVSDLGTPRVYEGAGMAGQVLNETAAREG